MANPSGTGLTPPPPAVDPSGGRQFLGHPPGLFLLFLVEMWERFSYYGMRALLMLYLISVTAVHQLPPGAYGDQLILEEIQEVEGQRDPDVLAVRTVEFHVLVGDGASGPPQLPEPPASTNPPSLVMTRLTSGPDASDPQQTVWTPQPGLPIGPIVVKGQPGGTGNRDTRGFENSEARFHLSNPTDKPVKVRLGVARPDENSRTHFRVNDKPNQFTVEIKPDSELKDGEKPFEVRVAINGHDSGRNWTQGRASVLYGWYTGLAYLFPILGGIIADKLIGTHRSMLIGGILITIGHIILGVSGMGDLAHSHAGMSMFIAGLAVIVLGTGHFKPTVSVMVGQLYPPGDPRRDGAFTIFYMGINLGAFICAFVCGTLGEKVGWHGGFGSAAVGMILGLLLYIFGKPIYLRGIGEAPRSGAGAASLLFLAGALVIAALFGWLYHAGVTAQLDSLMKSIQGNRPLAVGLVFGLGFGILAWTAWFVASNPIQDRGPVITIFVFMLFNAFFWIAFEQAGSSINVFTEQNTDRSVTLPSWLVSFCTSTSVLPGVVLAVIGGVAAVASWSATARTNSAGRYRAATGFLLLGVIGAAVLAVGILKPLGLLRWVGTFNEVPATWFQSINAGVIFLFAPLFAALWTGLGKRRMNPSQPVKIALGLILLGVGFLFMVWAGKIAHGNAAKAGMMLIVATYFWHTMGELCLSPTGLSYVTKAAPAKFVSLLMGIWFVSSFIANLGGGLVAAQVEKIERGTQKMPWNIGGQADFFFLFVVTSIGAGIVILALTPFLKKLMRNPED